MFCVGGFPCNNPESGVVVDLGILDNPFLYQWAYRMLYAEGYLLVLCSG